MRTGRGPHEQAKKTAVPEDGGSIRDCRAVRDVTVRVYQPA